MCLPIMGPRPARRPARPDSASARISAGSGCARWTTRSAGIATTRPDSVATSTSEMPRASPSIVFSAECPERLSKVVTIPLTVPRSPSRGAAAIMAPSMTRCCRNDASASSRARRSCGSWPSRADPMPSSWRRDRQSDMSSQKHREYSTTDSARIANITGPPFPTSSTSGFMRGPASRRPLRFRRRSRTPGHTARASERFFWMRCARNPCAIRVGMATMRPSSVATSTSEMPLASFPALPVPKTVISAKVLTMPDHRAEEAHEGSRRSDDGKQRKSALKMKPLPEQHGLEVLLEDLLARCRSTAGPSGRARASAA